MLRIAVIDDDPDVLATMRTGESAILGYRLRGLHRQSAFVSGWRAAVRSSLMCLFAAPSAALRKPRRS